MWLAGQCPGYPGTPLPRLQVCGVGAGWSGTASGPVPAPPKTSPQVLGSRSSAVAALQAMLTRGGSEGVVQHMGLEGGWELLRTSAGHEEGVTLLAR